MYKKPKVLTIDNLFEGVYAESGENGGDCYTVDAYIHQIPENGRGDYRIQVNSHHAADHNSNAQRLILTFNQPVEYVESQGTNDGSSGNVVRILYSYWNNHTDNIGLGDVVVTSDPGLVITGKVMEDIGKQY